MILGVMSDSHGNMRQVKYALRSMGDVDLICMQATSTTTG